MAIVPDADQFTRFAAAAGEGPIAMLNLIKFRDRAEYASYGAAVLAMVEKQQGRLLWHGEPQQTLIGDADWDYVALVEYPSRQAFLDMVTAPEYEEIHQHRESGIDYTTLIACQPFPTP